MRNIRNRLDRLCRARPTPPDLGGASFGADYDMLTEQQKDLYCRHLGIDREALEQIQLEMHGSLHFQIEEWRPRARVDPASVTEVEKCMNGGV